jgi:hypothetical protein
MMADKTDDLPCKGSLSAFRNIYYRVGGALASSKGLLFAALFVPEDLALEDRSVIFGTEIFTVRGFR